MSAARLCYVDGSFAYFTTQDLDKQTGDDWNDAPYEHNAGTPYEPYGHAKDWEIIKVAYDGALETPADIAGMNSRYSVDQINAGQVAWLVDRWGASKVAIQAGVTIEEFTALVKKAGGNVYLKA